MHGSRWVVLAGLLAATGGGAAETVNLVGGAATWSCGIDSGATTMALGATADAPLTVSVHADGDGRESFPKARLAWAEPQDWSRFTAVRTRLRVVCDAPGVRSKRIALVFYDQDTRREDLADRPMTQQVIAHSVPVNRWVEYQDWLLNIRCRTIGQLDLYLYEDPPAGVAHDYRWEFAQVALTGVGDTCVAFDTEVYAKAEMQATGTPPAAGRVVTGDGLSLTVDRAGGIAAVATGDVALGAPSGALTGLLVRDANRTGPPVAVGGEAVAVEGQVRQTAALPDLGLAVSAAYSAVGDRIEVTGTVTDTTGRDRAVTLYLAVPLAPAPWLWWDSVASSRTPSERDHELAYLEAGLAYGLNGAHSKYPLGAVTWPGQGGLTLGVRMDEPVVHRVGWAPDLRAFYLALDFGLVPEKAADGRSLAAASFRILLYRHDPAWGFRSALQRYYDFFPDFFTKRTPREGGWYVWGEVAKTEKALEAGFGYHWGPSGNAAVKWDNEHDVPALLYIEPEFFQLTTGDLDRAPTADEALARLRQVAAGDAAATAALAKLGYAGSYVPGSWVREHSFPEALQAVAAAAVASAEYDVDDRPYASAGQFPWMTESRWGVIFPCNLDPDIERGKGWFCHRVYLDSALRDPDAVGAHYDGIGLDSLGGYGQHERVDYRRANFAFSQAPLSFSALEHRPVRVAAFATAEWVRSLAADMHQRGLILMANCSWHITPGWLTFAAPYLDVFGAEAPSFADPDYARAIAYRKACTDLPYTPRPDWELPYHLLHDIYPGMGHTVEGMVPLTEPLRRLAAAGWEPITHARAEPAGLRVERYGQGDTVYLVVHNPGPAKVTATVTVDTAALQLGGLKATALLAGTPLPTAGTSLSLDLAPRATEAVVLKR